VGAIACHRRQLRAPNCIASRKAGSQQRSSGGTFRPDTGSSLNIEIVLKRPLFSVVLAAAAPFRPLGRRPSSVSLISLCHSLLLQPSIAARGWSMPPATLAM